MCREGHQYWRQRIPFSPRGAQNIFCQEPGTVRRPEGALRCNRANSGSLSGLPRDDSRNGRKGRFEIYMGGHISKRRRVPTGIISLRNLHGSIRPAHTARTSLTYCLLSSARKLALSSFQLDQVFLARHGGSCSNNSTKPSCNRQEHGDSSGPRIANSGEHARTRDCPN